MQNWGVMPIFGFRLRSLGQTSYFSVPEGFPKGGYAVLPQEQGVTIGQASSGPLTALPGTREEDLPAIVRQATAEDMEIMERHSALAQEAKVFCRERVRQRRLDMKLVDVEIYHDGSKYVFYFTAPTRIDFRELVKDLVREYRARIELRQIGVRHETQILGAIGNCGQICCCRRYLRRFAPVTIRMAKEQNLFLNPAKISGICGRLLCCLSYEQDNYEQFQRESPQPGKRYQTAKGLLRVLRVNMFRNDVAAADENNQEYEFTLDEWNALKPWRPQQPHEWTQDDQRIDGPWKSRPEKG